MESKTQSIFEAIDEDMERGGYIQYYCRMAMISSVYGLKHSPGAWDVERGDGWIYDQQDRDFQIIKSEREWLRLAVEYVQKNDDYYIEIFGTVGQSCGLRYFEVYKNIEDYYGQRSRL